MVPIQGEEQPLGSHCLDVSSQLETEGQVSGRERLGGWHCPWMREKRNGTSKEEVEEEGKGPERGGGKRKKDGRGWAG
jgi:hypothetical protein